MEVYDQIKDDDTLIVIDDTAYVCDAINLSWVIRKPFYSLYEKEYTTYAKYHSYTDEEYDSDLPMKDISNFLKTEGIKKEDIILIMRESKND